jgi:hypothetical protein
MFLIPVREELMAARALLDLFGDASGLKCNFNKCSISPIACSEVEVCEVAAPFPCQISRFPCSYLGLPLSLTNLTRAALQALIGKIARKLATWRTLLLTQSGRLILVKSVLSAMAIYHMLSMDLPTWVLKCIDKICRPFFWHGTDDAEGGHCLVAWKQVCTPVSIGGLGVLNLKATNDALWIRWRWSEREAFSVCGRASLSSYPPRQGRCSRRA